MKLTESSLRPVGRDNEGNPIEKVTQDMIAGIIGVSEDTLKQEAREKYKELEPAGFEHAPESAKHYRNALIANKDEDQMMFLQKNISYNNDKDKSINLIELGETFCADLTGTGAYLNFDAAKTTTASKDYHLLSDWNSVDDEQSKKDTDRYRLTKSFGEYADKGALASMLGLANTYYWTASRRKEEDGSEDHSIVRARGFNGLYGENMNKGGYRPSSFLRVCGFKNKK